MAHLFRTGGSVVHVLVVAALAGSNCVAASAAPSPVPAVAPTSASSPAPAPSPSGGTSGTALLDGFSRAWAAVVSYDATVTVMERKDAAVQNVVFAYAFHKPSSVSVHVDAGPNAGVTMVWGGGSTVTAHRGSGFAALFKKTFPLHDPQIVTIRGSSIDQLSFGAILAHAQQQAGVVTQGAESTAGAGGVDELILTPASAAADAGLTREVVDLSSTTHLPVQVRGYDGATLVRQIDFTGVKLVS